MDHSKITAINATISELRAHLPLGPAADLLSRLHRELASALVAPKVKVVSVSVPDYLQRALAGFVFLAGVFFALSPETAPDGAFESLALFTLAVLVVPRPAPKVEVTYRDAFGVMDASATKRLAEQLDRLRVDIGPMSALGSIDEEFAENLAVELKKLTDKDEPSPGVTVEKLATGQWFEVDA